jgi:hypothetical protein
MRAINWAPSNPEISKVPNSINGFQGMGSVTEGIGKFQGMRAPGKIAILINMWLEARTLIQFRKMFHL